MAAKKQKKKLDRKKPFSEVFGSGPARFEQDGVLFCSAGNEITETSKAAAPETENEKALKRENDAHKKRIAELEAQVEELEKKLESAAAAEPQRTVGGDAVVDDDAGAQGSLDDQIAAQTGAGA